MRVDGWTMRVVRRQESVEVKGQTRQKKRAGWGAPEDPRSQVNVQKKNANLGHKAVHHAVKMLTRLTDWTEHAAFADRGNRKILGTALA